MRKPVEKAGIFSEDKIMLDSFNRDIDYMRVSITDRCNLRCKYCMPEDLPDIPHDEILRYEEISRICRLMIGLGIRNFRVTGGEPLVRKGCVAFLKELKSLPGVGDVMLTTNGVLLERYIEDLRDMGINSINISLDTLAREVFSELTGRDEFDSVIRGIEAAVEAGLRVKINCVVMRGVNIDELADIAGLAERYPVDTRFIESMPIGSGSDFEAVPGDEIIQILWKKYPDLTKSVQRRGFGPAVYYQHDALKGTLGFINAISHNFCETCNRIRLTSDGFLKACLYYDQAVNLRSFLREGYSDMELIGVIKDAVAGKRERHLFQGGDRSGEDPEADKRKMSRIGG
jgi:cyclic pyranopterin phosphate synthase